MGQTLSEPVTVKETSSCRNDLFRVGASCMQGWRINMEDAHTHLLSLPDDKEAAFFAVYDGHGGAKVAKYAGCHLHRKIVTHPAYREGRIVEAIQKSFLEVDQDMLNDDLMKDELAGSTAVCVLLKGGKIYCGNVGDSRAIASVAGRVQTLSYDHKPSNKVETQRITAAGGWVECNRVNGNLALSRAFGDFVFKRNDKKSAEEQIVTAYPDVVVAPLSPDHEFILLACDGIWDVMSSEEVLEFVRMRIADRMEPEQICEELMTQCLAPDAAMGGLGCDNMTVVLVCLLNGRSYDVLATKCARPAAKCPSGQSSPRDSLSDRSFSSSGSEAEDEDEHHLNGHHAGRGDQAPTVATTLHTLDDVIVDNQSEGDKSSTFPDPTPALLATTVGGNDVAASLPTTATNQQTTCAEIVAENNNLNSSNNSEVDDAELCACYENGGDAAAAAGNGTRSCSYTGSNNGSLASGSCSCAGSKNGSRPVSPISPKL